MKLVDRKLHAGRRPGILQTRMNEDALSTPNSQITPRSVKQSDIFTRKCPINMLA